MTFPVTGLLIGLIEIIWGVMLFLLPNDSSQFTSLMSYHREWSFVLMACGGLLIAGTKNCKLRKYGFIVSMMQWVSFGVYLQSSSALTIVSATIPIFAAFCGGLYWFEVHEGVKSKNNYHGENLD